MRKTRLTTVTAVAATASLLLIGCGYDPGTVEDGGERRQEIEESREAGSEETDRQMTAHLLADAHVLVDTSDAVIQNPATPDDVRIIADRVRVLASGQIGSLPVEFDEGGSAALQAADVLEEEDPAGAYVEMLSSDLPRLSSAWGDLEDAQDETLANTARMSVEEIAAIRELLP